MEGFVVIDKIVPFEEPRPFGNVISLPMVPSIINASVIRLKING